MHHLSTAQREFGRSKCPANVAIRVPDEAALGRKPVHPPRTTPQDSVVTTGTFVQAEKGVTFCLRCCLLVILRECRYVATYRLLM